MCVMSGSSAAAAARSCDFFFVVALNLLLRAEVGHEGVPDVSLAVLSSWLHCSLARKAVASFTQFGVKKGEKLSGQARNRFNVKNEASRLSQGVSDDTCSPRGPTANWGTSACPESKHCQ